MPSVYLAFIQLFNIGTLREANGDAGAALVGKNDNIENSIKIEAANSENTAGSDNDSNSIRINLLNNANSASNASQYFPH